MLTAHQVLHGYTEGVFPMADPDDDNEIFWYEPKLRGVIIPSEFKVPKNLMKEFKKHRFSLKLDSDFEQTMKNCAEREETWISEEILEVYCGLHSMGYAHSFEVWQDGIMIGGLYGVAMGRVFFGESMFHKVTNASKIAMVFLHEWIMRNEYLLLDCQFITDHLRQFGAREITQEEYLVLLKKALE